MLLSLPQKKTCLGQREEKHCMFTCCKRAGDLSSLRSAWKFAGSGHVEHKTGGLKVRIAAGMRGSVSEEYGHTGRISKVIIFPGQSRRAADFRCARATAPGQSGVQT